MVSRRMILSRSRDDLNLNQNYMQQMEDEEDIWYSKEKLFKVSFFSFFHSIWWWWCDASLISRRDLFSSLSIILRNASLTLFSTDSHASKCRVDCCVCLLPVNDWKSVCRRDEKLYNFDVINFPLYENFWLLKYRHLWTRRIEIPTTTKNITQPAASSV